VALLHAAHLDCPPALDWPPPPGHRAIRCTLAEAAASGTDLEVENPAVIVIDPRNRLLPADDLDDTHSHWVHHGAPTAVHIL
jgi:hypothetical protein